MSYTIVSETLQSSDFVDANKRINVFEAWRDRTWQKELANGRYTKEKTITEGCKNFLFFVWWRIQIYQIEDGVLLLAETCTDRLITQIKTRPQETFKNYFSRSKVYFLNIFPIRTKRGRRMLGVANFKDFKLAFDVTEYKKVQFTHQDMGNILKVSQHLMNW